MARVYNWYATSTTPAPTPTNMEKRLSLPGQYGVPNARTAFSDQRLKVQKAPRNKGRGSIASHRQA